MTHKDIYTKFMIEYDKNNVASSYPSLTEYEVATVLDKAYNALIAQKVTGNNVRRATFEADVKSIADLEPLVVRVNLQLVPDLDIQNAHSTDTKYNYTPVAQPTGDPSTSNYYEISETNGQFVASSDTAVQVDKAYFTRLILTPEMLYFIAAYLKQDATEKPMDNHQTNRDLPVKLVNHDIATKFFATAYNLPWIKIPVAFLEGGILHIVYDPINTPKSSEGVDIVYIKVPNRFVKNLSDSPTSYTSFFDWGTGDAPDEYLFECNDTVAEELISLAVAFALENVESQRLNSKLNMRGLEA